MKVLCPNGHRIADISRGGTGWLIEIPRPDTYIRLGEDGQVVTGWARYPPLEELGARPSRMLWCARECLLEHSWFPVESAELERRAAAGSATWRLTR